MRSIGQILSNCRLRIVFSGGSGALGGSPVARFMKQLCLDERGQDIAEYAVMLAVVLVIVVGTVRLIGSNANNVFSQVGSSIH
jgi:Flp pilus assembly pilin Flp